MDKQTILDKTNVNINVLDKQLEALAKLKRDLGDAKSVVFDTIIMVTQVKEGLTKLKNELEKG